MNSSGEIYYPTIILSWAESIGNARSEINKPLKEKVEKYSRGENDLNVDVLGVRGEMIFSWYLYIIGSNHEGPNLIGINPDSTYDIKIADVRIDVKAGAPPIPYLMVNKEAHEKDKQTDYYAFVRLIQDGYARYWIIKHEEISTWKWKDFKNSEAYYKKVPDL